MNRRKNKRVTCLVPVEGKKGGIFDHTQTVDISKTGMGFISDHKIPLNKKIAIELDLNTENPVLVIGKVKWVRPFNQSETFRVGLHFEDILNGSHSRLNQHFV